jgi:hypothetical protein
MCSPGPLVLRRALVVLLIVAIAAAGKPPGGQEEREWRESDDAEPLISDDAEPLISDDAEPLIGIDFGSEWIKVAVAQGTAVDIVLNENTQLKSLAALSFPEGSKGNDELRLFGESAMSRPHLALQYIRELLGVCSVAPVCRGPEPAAFHVPTPFLPGLPPDLSLSAPPSAHANGGPRPYTLYPTPYALQPKP